MGKSTPNMGILDNEVRKRSLPATLPLDSHQLAVDLRVFLACSWLFANWSRVRWIFLNQDCCHESIFARCLEFMHATPHPVHLQPQGFLDCQDLNPKERILERR